MAVGEERQQQIANKYGILYQKTVIVTHK